MMQAYLQRKYGAARFDALDVCAFNVLQKLSRLANTPDHHDSQVDIAGYIANWEMILDKWSDGTGQTKTDYVDIAGGDNP